MNFILVPKDSSFKALSNGIIVRLNILIRAPKDSSHPNYFPKLMALAKHGLDL